METVRLRNRSPCAFKIKLTIFEIVRTIENSARKVILFPSVLES
jgi:hypothetical protein